MDELASLISLKVRDMLPAYSEHFDRNAFDIDSAQYGAEGKFVDVSENIISRVLSGERAIRVGNSLAEHPTDLGGDPNKGVTKALTIRYTYKNENRQQTISENEFLFLP